MKKILLLMTAALSLVMVGCEKPSNNEAPVNPSGKGGTIKFAVEATAPWEVSISNNDGISVTPTKGQAGRTDVTVTIGEWGGSAENPYPSTIVSFNNNATLKINQLKHPLYGDNIVTLIDLYCNYFVEARGFTEGNIMIQLSQPTNTTKANAISKYDIANCSAIRIMMMPSFDSYSLRDTEVDIDISNSGLEIWSSNIESCIGCSGKYSYTTIRTFKVNNAKLLSSLQCGSSYLTTLDLSGCESLTTFSGSTEFTKIDVSPCPKLEYLYLKSSKLTTLDVSSNPLLKTLDCTSSPFLKEIFLKTGQNIPTLRKDNQTVIKYK